MSPNDALLVESSRQRRSRGIVEGFEEVMQNLDDMNIGERFQFDRSIRLLFGMHPVASRGYQSSKVTLTLKMPSVRYIDNLLAQPG